MTDILRPKAVKSFRNANADKARAQRPANFSVKNEASDAPEILLYDEVGGWGVYASEMIPVLRSLDGEGKTITLRLNSPGGDVFEGVAIANALKGMKANTVAVVDGLAASIASVIAVSAKETRIHQNAMLMIHKPWSVVAGDDEAMIAAAGVLKKIETQLVNTYAEKAVDADREEIARMVAAETWLTGEDAVAMGFCDVLVEGMTVKNSLSSDFVDAAMFKNAPVELIDAPIEDASAAENSVEEDAPAAGEEAVIEASAAASEEVSAEEEKISEASATEEPVETNILAYAPEDIAAIKTACVAAKMPEQFDRLIAARVKPEDVRAVLFDLLVERDAKIGISNLIADSSASVSAEKTPSQKWEEVRARQFARVNGLSKN